VRGTGCMVSGVPLRADQTLVPNPLFGSTTSQSPVDAKRKRRRLAQPHELGFGPTGRCDHDLFAGRGSLEQLGQAGLRAPDVGDHTVSVVTRDHGRQVESCSRPSLGPLAGDLSSARQESVRGGHPSLDEGVSPQISYRVGEGPLRQSQGESEGAGAAR
jgi:hypothetical protein